MVESYKISIAAAMLALLLPVMSGAQDAPPPLPPLPPLPGIEQPAAVPSGTVETTAEASPARPIPAEAEENATLPPSEALVQPQDAQASALPLPPSESAASDGPPAPPPLPPIESLVTDSPDKPAPKKQEAQAKPMEEQKETQTTELEGAPLPVPPSRLAQPTAPASEGDFLFDSFFSEGGLAPKPQQPTAEEIRLKQEADALATEEEERKAREEADKKTAQKQKPVRVKFEKVHVFKSQILPPQIYKKTYDNDNRHLPQAIYERDYDLALFTAVGEGNINAARALLESGRNIESTTVQGDTPLIYAVRNGQVAMTRLLLARGANPNAVNYKGYTALHFAAYGGRYELVEALLTKNANPDAPDGQGTTPLMLAVRSGSKMVAETLIRRGADINARNTVGQTPLHMVSRSGKQSIAALLVSYGADAAATDKYGNTARLYAGF